MSINFLGGGGIKVDDPGSIVGRGWMLNCGGGIITRNIRGVPDDYLNRMPTPGTETVKTSNNGILYNDGIVNEPDGERPFYIGPLFDYNYGISDSQHDIFEFNIAGRTGRFFIGKNREILVADGSQIKIIPDFTNSTLEGSEIGSFTIIDEQGIQYFFEMAEISENTRINSVEGNWRPFGSYYFKPYASSWLLTRIEAPFREERIELEYYQKDSKPIVSKSWYYKLSRRTNDPSGLYPKSSYTHSEDVKAAPLEIKSISFSDSTKIKFHYFTEGGVPSHENAVICNIEILNSKNDVIRKFLFNYIWWNSANEMQYVNYSQGPLISRNIMPGDRRNIHLEGIYSSNSTGEIMPLCTFMYYLNDFNNESFYDESLVGAKNAIDYWGFPNGRDNGGNLLLIPAFNKPAADRSPDLNYAQMGALKKIYYATGGSEEFEYELNAKRVLNHDKLVGGIRLKKRILHDGIDSAKDIIKEYRYVERDGKSSGFLGDSLLFSYTIPNGTNWTDSVDVSHPVNPLSTIEGCYAGYRRVEEITTGKTGTNGKTVYTYTDLSFTNYWSPPDYFPYTPVEEPTWAIGLPDTISYYDKNDRLVKRTINRYNIVEKRIIDENYRSLYVSEKAYQVAKVRNYYPLVGRSDLTETRECTYGSTDPDSIETVRQFVYDSVFHSIRTIRQKDSRRKIVENVIHYPADYNLGGGSSLALMIEKNMLNFPVETETWLKDSLISYLTSARVTAFSELSNGIIRPTKSYQSTVEAPVSQTQTFDATVLFPPSFALDQNLEFTAYDTKGRLISYASRKDGVTSVIYDPSNNIMAKAKNASFDAIAYTDFDSHETGNWTYDSSGIVNVPTKTDRSAFIGVISKTNLPIGNYRVSLWARGAGNISVNNVNTAIDNEWKFYVWNCNNVSAVSVNSNGNQIDGAAICPSLAQMRTYTYKNGVGISSECDDNGAMNTYDYDAFNRLQFIRDRDQNIVKAFTYNTRTYLNNEASETYTDYFCSTGIPNGSVTYTVPAKKYASLVSQADADFKAQWDINFNGRPYANSVGPCIPVYYNTEKSIIMSRNNCPSGYHGTAVAYVVPKEKYSSLISQEDVDGLAQADLDNNAVPYANANGTCQKIITLSSNNTGASGYFAVFTSNASGTYDFAIPPSGGVLGEIPEGNYDVQILNPGGNGIQCSFVVGCNYSSAGTEASFNDVAISEECSTITLDAM